MLEVCTDAGLDYFVLKKPLFVRLAVATMWIRWKRPGLHEKRGECVFTKSKQHTDQLSPWGTAPACG